MKKNNPADVFVKKNIKLKLSLLILEQKLPKNQPNLPHRNEELLHF